MPTSPLTRQVREVRRKEVNSLLPEEAVTTATGLRAMRHVAAEHHAHLTQLINAAPIRTVGSEGGVRVGQAVGMPMPGASRRIPRARLSANPAAHLLTVLKVAGATAIASAVGEDRTSLGARQTDFT